MNKERVISAAILVPLVIIMLWIKPLFYVMNIVVVVFFVNEFLTINNVKEVKLPLVLAALAPLPIIITILFKNSALIWLSLFYIVVALYVIMLYALYKVPVKEATRFTSLSFFAIIYATIISFLSLVLAEKRGALLLLNMFLVIWLADTAAYFVGTKIGRHKLMERISPNKTVEGAIASLITAMITQLVLNYVFNLDLRAVTALFWGFSISIFAQIGDLVESMFKRNAGVKDSSNLIPGHGGVMDRLDSILFTAPLYYIFIKIFL